jgi:DNA-binding winged helix-turn-helix (wHTH) protein
MEPQVFDLLVFLVSNRDRVVSKDDLLASVWGGRIVSESTLASRINAARRIIGDSGEQQRLIRTTIGKGVRFVGAVQERQAAAEPAISIPPRLSIIVLPFTNLSNDPELEFSADGITDDLTTDLSQIPGSFVIAHNTALTLKGDSVDVKRIGREFGACYVVEGSLRRAGEPFGSMFSWSMQKAARICGQIGSTTIPPTLPQLRTRSSAALREP